MKKTLALILAILSIVLCFSACGKVETKPNNENSNPSTDVVEDNQSEDNKTNETPSSTLDWKLENISTPDFSDVIIEEKIISNTETKVKIGKTPFNYDINNAKSVFSNSKFISDKYILGASTHERIEGETYKQGNKVNFEIEDKVVGTLKESDYSTKEYFSDLEVIFERETKLYDNYNFITFSFSGLEISQNTQKELYNLIKECVGEELAKFMVYAKDDDGMTAYDKPISDGGMGVVIKKENVTYGIDRSITEDKDDIKDNRISFRVFVKEANFYNSFTYYDGDYVSIYDKDFKYKITNINPNITDFSQSTFDMFAKEYFAIGNGDYVRSRLDYVNLEKIVMDDGRMICRFDTEFQKGCSDIANLIAPEFEIDYSVVEKDNDIVLLDISYTGAPGPVGDGGDENTSYKNLLKIQKEQIKFLFPLLDISSIDDSNPTSQSTKGTTSLFNKECQYNASASIGHTFADTFSGEWKTTISYRASN